MLACKDTATYMHNTCTGSCTPHNTGAELIEHRDLPVEQAAAQQAGTQVDAVPSC